MSKIDNRSRIIRINNYIIITNYKCMFTSLNKLKIDELNPDLNNIDYKIIFLYRNPNNKIISLFLNICYETIKNNKDNWLISLLKKHNKYNIIKKYLLNITKSNIIKAFIIFINLLPKIKYSNPHIQSQILILNHIFIKYKLNIKNLYKSFNIDNKNDIIKFENIIKQKILKKNKSDKNYKNILKFFLYNNKYYSNLIDKIYIEDNILINKLKKYNI